MKDEQCVAFLQWALPRLDMRWDGFRKVRRQVCRRIALRMGECGARSVGEYVRILETGPEEWKILDGLCRVTISRFCRDRRVFDVIGRSLLPSMASLAESGGEVGCLSLGCASGEEAYTMRFLWEEYAAPLFSEARMIITAIDGDPHMLERARRACYGKGSMKELPAAFLERFFVRDGDHYRVREDLRDGITFLLLDVRKELPPGLFHLVLCRNLVFTYFSLSLQEELLERIRKRLLPGGLLVVGCHERLPGDGSGFELVDAGRMIYRKV